MSFRRSMYRKARRYNAKIGVGRRRRSTRRSRSYNRFYRVSRGGIRL